LVTISINPVNQLLLRPWSIPNDCCKCACAPTPVTHEVELHSWHTRKRKYQCYWTACSSATSSSGQQLLNYQCKWTKNSSISSENGPVASLHPLEWIFWPLNSPLGRGPISCHKTFQLSLPVDKELLSYIH